MILFFNSASCTLSLFTMFDADCDSERLCLFTWVRLRDENVGLDSSLFLRLSSLRLWKRVRALTSACSAVCLISLISFWTVLSGAIFALAEYCNDFGRERMFYESNESMSHESWVNESMSQIWKNKSFGRNNKIKHYFYLICPLASLLPAHARPISDMKSQPTLFVSSIPGAAPRLFSHISWCTNFKQAS